MALNRFSRFIHSAAAATEEPDFDRVTAELLEREDRLWSVTMLESKWAVSVKPDEMRGTLRPRVY